MGHHKDYPYPYKRKIGHFFGGGFRVNSSYDMPNDLVKYLNFDIDDAGVLVYFEGLGVPPQKLIDAVQFIAANQYIHIEMPFGLKSYVWPSGERQYVRCDKNRAIDHFHCDL